MQTRYNSQTQNEQKLQRSAISNGKLEKKIEFITWIETLWSNFVKRTTFDTGCHHVTLWTILLLANVQTSAGKSEHIVEMWLKTVIPRTFNINMLNKLPQLNNQNSKMQIDLMLCIKFYPLTLVELWLLIEY